MSSFTDSEVRLLLMAGSDEDAEPLLQEIRRAQLAPISLRVETLEALQAMLHQRPWDLVLLDEGSPDHVGDALRLLHAHAPGLPAVVVGAEPGEEAAVRAMRAGAQDYVSRQRLDRLAPAVARVLQAAEARRSGGPHARPEAAQARALKLEALARFARGIAHDLNNLLTTIKGYSAMARDALAEGQPAREDIAEVLGAADRAAGLSRQLVLLAARQQIAPRATSLNALVLDAREMLRHVLGSPAGDPSDEASGIRLETDLSPDTPHVSVDVGQLRQALAHLALNARDAMPSGGHLVIQTRRVPPDEPLTCYDPTAPTGECALLAVRDTGVGMSEDALAHLFEPYYTTKLGRRGAGLGLPVVYGIVRRHRGCVTVQSQPGRGTQVSIYLPRAERDA